MSPVADGIEGADVPLEGWIRARLDPAVIGATIHPVGGDRCILGRSFSGHWLLPTRRAGWLRGPRLSGSMSGDGWCGASREGPQDEPFDPGPRRHDGADRAQCSVSPQSLMPA
jgi:hypothetical protein